MNPRVLDTLAPVGLEELNDSAALLTRTDRKYLLVPGRHDQLTTQLHDQVLAVAGARSLQIAGTRDFGYRSTYFDTAEHTGFTGAAHRRRRRFKVRLRHYVDTGECHLEVKTRGMRGSTVKERLELPAGTDRLGAAAREHVAERLAESRIEGVDVNDLRPVLTTHYRRRTVLLPGSGARLTLDSALAWELPDGRRQPAPELLVLETKTPVGSRAAVDRFLWAHGCRPARFSKYATGRALLDPDLPRNRWHRVITRDLDPHTHQEDR